MREKASFEGHDGQTLAGLLELPDGAPQAVALFAHCFTCSKDIAAASRISRALSLHGIATLRFDFTGLGNSDGDFANTHFSSNVADVECAADYLSTRFDQPLVLIGHSLGGAAVLRAAPRVARLKAVVTIGAPSRPEHVLHLLSGALDEIEERGEAEVLLGGRAFTIKNEFVEDLKNLEGHGLERLTCAKLVFHSPLDDTVGIENARALFEVMRHPKSFVSLDDADHLVTQRRDSEYVADVLAAWVSRYLPPETPKQGVTSEEGEVIVRGQKGSFRTQVQAGTHAWTADEPRSVGGTNRGPSPYDMLLAALGACTSMTLHMYAKRKGLPLSDVEVRLTHRREHEVDGEKGGTLDKISRAIALGGPLTAEQEQRLAQIADRCPVHRTLENAPRIETNVSLASEK